MADNEDRTEGARFAASVPQRHEPFPLKGCGALDWGMQSRRPTTSSSGGEHGEQGDGEADTTRASDAA